MKQSPFTSEQIIGMLQAAERGERPIVEIGRTHAITETTFYRWRRENGGLAVPEAQRLKELEQENTRLKRLLAERDLEIDALRQYLAKK
jgi:putative transposase